MTLLPTQRIEFRVYGVPAPGGSKKAFYIKKLGRAIVTDACKRNKPWRADVAAAAMEAYQGPLLTGPINLTVEFIMPRPKYHYRTGRGAGEMKPDAPCKHIKRPDVDKLSRAVMDALTKVVWLDDSQVCDKTVSKRYGERPGARVVIEEIN